MGKIGINEATMRPEFEKPIICPQCGERTMDEVPPDRTRAKSVDGSDMGSLTPQIPIQFWNTSPIQVAAVVRT